MTAVPLPASPASSRPPAVAGRRARSGGSFSLMFSAGVALTALGAMYQPAFLGYLAASPGVLLIACSLLMLPSASRGRTRQEREVSWLIGWGLLISVPSVLMFGFVTSYLAKTFTLLVLTTIWISPLMCVPHVNKRHLRAGLVTALATCLAGFVLADLLRGTIPASLNGLIFGGEYADYDSLRPRAFMQENSHFATIVGRYLIVLFLLHEGGHAYSARRLGWFVALLVMILGGLGSKGGAISVLVAAMVVGMTRKLLPLFLLLLPFLGMVVAQQANVVAVDIENFTSVSTRATLLLTTLAGVVCDPFGYGFYGFYGAIQTFGGWAMNWLGDQVPLILTEVVDIVEELNNVSTKSTLMDFALIFGAPFLMLMWTVLRRCQLKDPRVQAALVYAFLSALSTSGHESISFFLVLAVVSRWYPRSHGHKKVKARDPRRSTARVGNPPDPQPE